MSADEALAYLHARGLPVSPEAFSEAVRAALEALDARYFGLAGEEGLTAAEADVARSGGLEEGPVPAGADPLLRGAATYAALAEGGLTTGQAADHLGVTDARVRQRLQAGTLLGIRVGRSWRLPAFQFTPAGELPGWGEVCARIPRSASPVAVERWLTSANSDLFVGEEEAPCSPRQWLLDGRAADPVAALASELA